MMSGKRQRQTPVPPQPGEPGYRTPTQLRNARKRRAKQQQQQQQQQHSTLTTSTIDPSQLYRANPQAAPVVQAARSFFQSRSMKNHNNHMNKFAIAVGPKDAWRTVSKLAVRSLPPDGQQQQQQRRRRLAIGLFAPHSHHLVAVPNSPAHHPSINRTIQVLERLCHSQGVQPYDDILSGKGQLRHVAMNVERTTGKVQLTLVWNSMPPSHHDKEEHDEDEDEDAVLDSVCRAIVKAAAVASEEEQDHDTTAFSRRPRKTRKRRRGRTHHHHHHHSEDHATVSTSTTATTLGTSCPQPDRIPLHSLWVHYNSASKHTNAIFAHNGGPEQWQLRHGPAYITEELDLQQTAGQDHFVVPLHFAPNVFRQANLDAFTAIVARIRTYLSHFRIQSPTCVELYGGVGTIGLNVADLVSSLVSSDENPFNLDCFTASVSQLPRNLQKRLSYVPKNASDMVQSQALDDAQVVIVDPPRKGLDTKVLQALCTAEAPELLIYVSCGFDAFRRDCTVLLGTQQWQIDHAEGHVLFPGSNAIETLAFFVKK